VGGAAEASSKTRSTLPFNTETKRLRHEIDAVFHFILFAFLFLSVG
jgi:hypothetical protein